MRNIHKFSMVVIIMFTMVVTTACRTQVPVQTSTQASPQETDKIYTYTATPSDKDNFSSAQFSVWCPKDTKTYRGILYLGAGYEYSSDPMMYEQKWQDLARENGLILLTSNMKSRTEANTEIAYWQAEYGSGQAMLNALSYFAKEANHPELENAPLAMWGFSAGAQFNYNFACWKPERVITFVAVKGGYYLPEPKNQTLKTPALFFTGENDLQRRKDVAKELFDKNIKNEPLWCLANEPASGHEIGQTDKLAIPWLKEIIKQRLPQEADASKGPIALKDVNQSLVWLGDRTDGYIAPILDYKKEKKNSSWIPNEDLAKMWKDFHLHQ